MDDIIYRIKEFVSEFKGKRALILLYVADFVGNWPNSLLIVYDRGAEIPRIFGFSA